jgi:Ca2+/H+ antiporter
VSAVMLSVIAVLNLVLDGRTNWFEGVQLPGIYTVLAMALYFI